MEEKKDHAEHHTKDVELKNDETLHARIIELLEKDIKWSQVLFHQNKKIKRRMTLLVVGNYLRLCLILIPIVVAFFYLLPFFREEGGIASLIHAWQASVANQHGVERIIDEVTQ